MTISPFALMAMGVLFLALGEIWQHDSSGGAFVALGVCSIAMAILKRKQERTQRD